MTLARALFFLYYSMYCNSAAGCPTSTKSVTHKQLEWSVITGLVQVTHYIIWFYKIYIDISMMDYMCQCQISYYTISGLLQEITPLYVRSTIFTAFNKNQRETHSN